MYSEASGPSLSREIKGKRALHHLRLHGSAASTDTRPAWVVSHFKSERDRTPTEHHFSDGAEMLAHIGNSAGVPAPENEGND